MEQDMKYIYQVYQDGSFSAAAEHLYMSQPALSIAVKRVEESVGAELFDRSRRPAFIDHILLAVHRDIPLPPELDRMSLTADDILSRRHTEEDCPGISLEHFKDVEFILLEEGNNLYARSQQMFEEAGFSPKIKMTIAQMVTSYRLADNGLGAAFISDRLVRSKRSNLRFFKLDYDCADRMFYFLVPKRAYAPFSVRSFIEYAAAHIPHPDFLLT